MFSCNSGKFAVFAEFAVFAAIPSCEGECHLRGLQGRAAAVGGIQSSACDPTALKSQQQNGASCGTLHMTASTKKEETFLVLAVMCNVRRPRREASAGN